MARMITLKSSDVEVFEVEEAVAMMWQTIKHMIEDDCAASAIPLPNVTSKILSQVIEYSKRHAVGEAAYDAACDAAAGAAAAAAASAGKTAASAAVAAVAFGAAVAADVVAVAAAADKAVAAKADADAAAKAVAAAEAAKAAAAAAYAKLKEYDAEFVKVDQATLFDLILAANYLNIEGLLDLTCRTVSDMIKGKTPEEIRKTFNIKENFTPEEEEEIRRENPWAFERRSDAEGEPVGF